MQKKVFQLLVDNTSGVLSRIAGLFLTSVRGKPVRGVQFYVADFSECLRRAVKHFQCNTALGGKQICGCGRHCHRNVLHGG